jgi:Zn ribbon nucleic-acid-binding protein
MAKCPKCNDPDTVLETYEGVHGPEQLCTNCGWTSEDKASFELMKSVPTG